MSFIQNVLGELPLYVHESASDSHAVHLVNDVSNFESLWAINFYTQTAYLVYTYIVG